MEINTKFDIGDICWIEFSGKAIDLQVNGVYVDISEDNEKIEYTIGQPDSIKKYREVEIFKLRDVCGMKYNSAFTIGDIVWFIHNDEVCSGKIKSVRYIKFISSIDSRVIENEMYGIENISNMFDSCKLFKAKEDLIKSL
jgi:hypothetical protein